MSYWKKIEYEIVPKESFAVIRGCAGCGRKTHFVNTGKFRVNANGNKLDVWLIYQCEICRHTFNLAIYERQSPSAIPKEEYERFLRNDEELAELFGRNLSLFQKNKAQVDHERLGYDIVKRNGGFPCGTAGNNSVWKDDVLEEMESILLTVHNPCGLKIRPEKLLANLLGLSRSQVQKMLRAGEIEWETNLPQTISIRTGAGLFGQNERADGRGDEKG